MQPCWHIAFCPGEQAFAAVCAASHPVSELHRRPTLIEGQAGTSERSPDRSFLALRRLGAALRTKILGRRQRQVVASTAASSSLAQNRVPRRPTGSASDRRRPRSRGRRHRRSPQVPVGTLGRPPGSRSPPDLLAARTPTETSARCQHQP
jgi:hypothetical protein